jgi:hypothetical protein
VKRLQQRVILHIEENVEVAKLAPTLAQPGRSLQTQHRRKAAVVEDPLKFENRIQEVVQRQPSTDKVIVFKNGRRLQRVAAIIVIFAVEGK